MTLPTLMQDRAAADTQKQALDNSIKQSDLMQKISDVIKIQRNEFNEYRKDFNDFKKSMTRDSGKTTISDYIKNIKTAPGQPKTSNTRDSNNTDFLKGAMTKLLSARENTFQQKIADDTKITREYMSRMSQSTDKIRDANSEKTRNRDIDVLSDEIAAKIDIDSGLSGLGVALGASLAALGKSIVTGISGVMTGLGLGSLTGVLAGLAGILTPGNIGQNYNFPQDGPLAGSEINPITNAPWTKKELDEYKKNPDEYAKQPPRPAPPTLTDAPKTNQTPPKVPSVNKDDQEPSMWEKIGMAGEGVASLGLMLAKKHPLGSKIAAGGGFATALYGKYKAGEEIKAEDLGVNISRSSQASEVKKTDEDTRPSWIRRFAEANSMKDFKKLFGGNNDESIAAEARKKFALNDPRLSMGNNESQPTAKNQSLVLPNDVPSVNTSEYNLSKILEESQRVFDETKDRLMKDSEKTSVVVNNVNTNNVSGEGGPGISFPNAPAVDTNPTVLYYQAARALMGLQR